MAYYTVVLVTLAWGLVQCYSQYSFESHKYCDDLSPYYGNLSLDQIAGVWYGVEKIPHAKGEYKIEHTQECFYIDIKERYIEDLYPTHDFDEEALLGMWYVHEYVYHKENRTATEYNPYCPIVQLRKFEDYVHGGLLNHNLPTPPTPYPQLTNNPYVQNRQFGLQEHYRIRYFVLEWHEGMWHDDYHIKVNTSHKGFWATDVPSRSVDPQYRFFGGVIQVLKVANTHLVLNFCMRLPNSQLFSVVLSRNENQLTPEDLAGIHNVFTMKRLSTSALKRVCENSATNIGLSMSVLLVVVFSLWGSRL